MKRLLLGGTLFTTILFVMVGSTEAVAQVGVYVDVPKQASHRGVTPDGAPLARTGGDLAFWAYVAAASIITGAALLRIHSRTEGGG